MEISPLLLFWLTTFGFFCGCFFGALHDFHRLLRVLIGCNYGLSQEEKTKKLHVPGKGVPYILRQSVIFLQDVVWFVLGGACIILLNYRLNYGQFRIFSVLSFCLGFLLYYITLGKLMLAVNQWMVRIIRRIAVAIFYILYKPVRVFVELFRKSAKNIFANIKKNLAKKKKKVYNEYSQKCISKRTADGFLTGKSGL